MTEKTRKRRKLSFEILCTVALCFALSLLLYFLIAFVGRSIVDSYCFYHDIYLDEFELLRLDNTVYGIGFAVSALFFTVMFLVLFGEKLAYVRHIIAGVQALQKGDYSHRVKLMGNNELTQLAGAVNYLSESEQQLRDKEKRLSEEREELVRTLSHDIRTPLTSLMSYTELLAKKQPLDETEQREYLALVDKKTAQIKQLTDILLEGGKRDPEHFEDARLLFEQLADEFTDALDGDFTCSVSLSPMPAFGGSFDVGELRRIFDNLISNVQKYADPAGEVALHVQIAENGLVIRQSNAVKHLTGDTEGYRMGIISMRRIAQHYSGTVTVTSDQSQFTIEIKLCDF